ncbi:hypothetical protein KNLIENLN_00085 [Sinorhizobium phage NV1.1.1]|nr:hypothetical protein KNLIENLN_00085 [Sinorhizobium phage NV1.1.1]
MSVVYYTYLWKRADGTPFYVGKGKGRRAYSMSGRSKEFKEIRGGEECSVEIVDTFIHESQAFAHEMELIQKFGRRDMGGLLINKSNGGEGPNGYSLTDGHRARISKAQMGRLVSDAHRAAISAAHRGKVVSEETRAKLRARVMSEESKRALSEKQKGHAYNAGIPKSEEHKLKIALRRRRAPPKGQFKGVSLQNGWWIASIKINNEKRYLGCFRNPEDGARKYDEAANQEWGTDCYLNFPNEVAA